MQEIKQRAREALKHCDKIRSGEDRKVQDYLGYLNVATMAVYILSIPSLELCAGCTGNFMATDENLHETENFGHAWICESCVEEQLGKKHA